ncbi:MAG: tyrosine-type recombinase/integrase [Candidatus Helarchaeota archaeon]
MVLSENQIPLNNDPIPKNISRNEVIIEEFLRKKMEEGKSESLRRNYRYDILDFIKSVQINSIENAMIEDIEEYIDILRRRKCSGSTVNRRLSAIKALYKFLIKKNRRYLRRLKRNSDAQEKAMEIREKIEEFEEIIDIEHVKAIKKEKLPFTLEEIRKILLEAKKDSLRNYLILKISAVGTGARNTAVRKLKKYDLECYKCQSNCKDCIPTVKILRKGKTEKNDEERNKIRVRIEPRTCKELKEFLKHDTSKNDLVFKSRKHDSVLSILQLNRILKKAVKQSNIELKGRTFHSLRHTFITEGIKNGTPYGHMARQVDHEGKLGITGKYEHMTAKDLKINFINIDI